MGQQLRSNRLHAALLAAVLVFAPAPARAQPVIRALTDVIEGHSVGGVSIDAVGDLYVADFADIVWKMPLEGGRYELASGFYGASGNTIDRVGNLLQSSYYADTVTRVDRKGKTTVVASTGLSGPVGVTVDDKTGDLYVANCRGNFVARITPDGTVSPFAKSDLFRCPNGISFDKEGNLYVVNFRDNKMFKIDRTGAVAQFTTVSDKGLGHLCFKNDRFYVTASQAHSIYEVKLDGTATRILGTGERGIVDGAGDKARLSSPNGIACHPWAPRLYINEFVSESTSALPPRAIVREIILGSSP